MLSCCFLVFFVGEGAFVIGLNQISSFVSKSQAAQVGDNSKINTPFHNNIEGVCTVQLPSYCCIFPNIYELI